MTDKESTTESNRPTMVSDEPPEFGNVVLERDFPSDEALITPTVVRVMDFLVDEGIVLKDQRNKVGLCLQEALQNAVLHGNRSDFQKLVKLRVSLSDVKWAIRIDDDGDGFRLEDVPDPLEDEALWVEGGRGLSLMTTYMDSVEYYRDGRTLVISRFL